MKPKQQQTESPGRENLLDRVIWYLSPGAGMRRLRARKAMELLSSYDGASRVKRTLKSWTASMADADTDILADLPTLRERSRDLCRNNPLAGGAIKTKVTNVVGTGLGFHSQLDRDVLNLTDDQADDLENLIEREWKLFWNTKACDLTRTLTGRALTRLVYRQQKENGDVFILLVHKNRPGVIYDLKLQVIEADRVCNKDNAPDTDRLAGGVEKDEDGAPVKYHILNVHPGRLGSIKEKKWEIRDAWNEQTGLPNIIHFFDPTRPGQSRGVPDLAAVIEPFKQLGRYTEAEIMAAVVSGFFTVFVESDPGNLGSNGELIRKIGGAAAGGGEADLKLGNGLIVGLNPGEKIHDSNPGRPNVNYDGFVMAVLRQIGAGLELPFEILIKHFTASYSAARAALVELWKYVQSERQLLVDSFFRPVQEVWMWEAVASGRIPAPGYFADPGIRQAYLAGTFTGPAKGQINELAEVKAAAARVSSRLSTLAGETAELTGGDWEKNHVQQVKERKKQVADKLIIEAIPEEEIPEP